MDCTRAPIRLTYSYVVALFASLLFPGLGSAQVRTKQPDRGVYQPPRLQPSTDSSAAPAPNRVREIAELVRADAPLKQNNGGSVNHTAAAEPDIEVDPPQPRQPRGGPLVDVELVDVNESPSAGPAPEAIQTSEPRLLEHQPKLQRVAHEDVILVEPHRQTVIGEQVIVDGGEVWVESPGSWTDQATHAGCDGCNSGECDSIGCDSAFHSRVPAWLKHWLNGSICCGPDRWFGSAEVLLMWRRGDRLPPLVTTGSDADPDTAGQLGEPGTQVLMGNESILKDLTSGGRFMLGTWLDSQNCRSLTARGWFAGDETFGFFADQDRFPVITRPFLNVSDDQAAAQDALLVAFPDRASGSISVLANSELYGGDVAVREFCYGKYGATLDLLYGYQYMRLNEELRISSTSTSLDDDFAPVGSVISVNDSFDTKNEFNGGQVGLVSRYREGCWSFNGMLKLGFGSLRREATLTGSTRTSIDDATALDPNGLLVRSTNRGTTTDHTFAWVPELDLSLGWQRYRCFDVTCGYHLVAMTDALRPSGAIDPNLAVNLSDPPIGQQSPSVSLRYDTYYVQGIHFGLQYVY